MTVPKISLKQNLVKICQIQQKVMGFQTFYEVFPDFSISWGKKYLKITVKRGYSGQISAFLLNLNDIRVRIDLKVMSIY